MLLGDYGPIMAGAAPSEAWMSDSIFDEVADDRFEQIIDGLCVEGACVEDLEQIPTFPVDQYPGDMWSMFLDGAPDYGLALRHIATHEFGRKSSRPIDIDIIQPGVRPDGFKPNEGDAVETLGIGGSYNEQALYWQFRKRIGDYQIRASLKRGFLPSCIRRTGYYVGLELQHFPGGRSGQVKFNLHITGWWTWRGPCFAVWESKSGYCRNSCTWNLWNFVYAVAAGIAAWYLSGWIVGAIGTASAGAVVGGLTLAPGIPPPP